MINSIKFTFVLTISITLFSILGCSQEQEKPKIASFTEDFEVGLSQWKIEECKGAAPALDKSKAKAGSSSLLLTDTVTLVSEAIKLPPRKSYEFRLDSFSEHIGRFWVRVEEYDRDNNLLTTGSVNKTSDGMWEAKRSKRNFWYTMHFPFDTSADCDHVKIRLRKWSKDKVWLDNIRIDNVESHLMLKAEPLFPGKPKTFNNLSLALPGPEGIMYPNWTWAGAHKPAQDSKNVIMLQDVDGHPDDGKCDADAIEGACELLAEKGGGIIKLSAGTYRLTRKIMITQDNITIRGEGQDKTIIEFNLPDNGVGVFPVAMGYNVFIGHVIEVFFPKADATKVELKIDGKTFASADDPKKFEALPDKPDYMKFVARNGSFIDKLPEGRYTATAYVHYNNGEIKTTAIPMTREISGPHGGKYSHSVISIAGQRISKTTKVKFTNSALRGDRTIRLEDASTFKAGDFIVINAPATKRWNRLVHNICLWGSYRMFVTTVEKVAGNEITLTQPLRIDYPLEDEPVAQQFHPVRNCALEDMTITQKGDIQVELKMGCVIFSSAADCRAENVNVERPGTQAIFGTTVKWCEIRNCVFRNPWRTKRGGLAYAGWERAWDCLIENMETFRMRHAPLLNWTCSGNVIRDSVFHESDGQWHCGWCRDNLYEQCRIESTTRKYNGYGYGLFSTPIDDSMHGPQGPRNVVYNCDVISLKDGIHMGGMGQQWMIMYNRFEAAEGGGIISRFGCLDNWIKGNIFVLKDNASPLIYYEFMHSNSDLVVGNTIYGGDGRLSTGPGKAGIDKDNIFKPLEQYEKQLPAAPAPSIYKWQIEKYGSGVK